jgi:esterase/lipase superfamily enzyme
LIQEADALGAVVALTAFIMEEVVQMFTTAGLKQEMMAGDGLTYFPEP